jgi:hypothetical protein
MCTKCKSPERYLGKSYCYDCYKTDALKFQAAIRHRNRKFIFKYLNLYGQCIDCGNKDWKVLEFDHQDQDTKSADVSRFYSNHYSFKRIKEEIKKCDIRCANCHKIRTRKQLGWFNFE